MVLFVSRCLSWITSTRIAAILADREDVWLVSVDSAECVFCASQPVLEVCLHSLRTFFLIPFLGVAMFLPVALIAVFLLRVITLLRGFLGL